MGETPIIPTVLNITFRYYQLQVIKKFALFYLFIFLYHINTLVQYSIKNIQYTYEYSMFLYINKWEMRPHKDFNSVRGNEWFWNFKKKKIYNENITFNSQIQEKET